MRDAVSAVAVWKPGLKEIIRKMQCGEYAGADDPAQINSLRHPAQHVDTRAG
jgi:hypothetical protein